MAAATSPALPVFSYAQAAKGRATAPSATPPQAESSANTPDIMSTGRKSSIPQPERLESLNTAAGAGKEDEIMDDISKMVHGNVDVASTVKSNLDKSSSLPTKPISSSHSDSKQISGSTSPNLMASVPTLPREAEYSPTPNGSSESWDKQSETSATADRPAPMTESGKEKNGEDDWVNVPPKALKAAPIPAVNIWQQRKEAQEAKAKANAAPRSPAAAAVPIKSKPPTQPGRHVESQPEDDEAKRRPSGKLPDKSDAVSKKKQLDETRTTNGDDGKRPSRPGRASEPDKDIGELCSAPPPVGDAASWPTPDTANHEDRKKPHSQDNSRDMRSNQRWVPLPYVPTAKFRTQLPPTVSKRGGRSTRGARETQNRGGHVSQSSISDKPEKMRPTGAPFISKQVQEHQRGRPQETLTSSRATSAPSQGRRAASVGPALGDQRRTTEEALSEHGSPEGNKHETSAPHHTVVDGLSANTEGGNANKSRADSRSFSHQCYGTGVYDSSRHASVESHAHPRSYVGAERTHAEIGRQGEAPQDKSKARESDAKAELWRDPDAAVRSEQRHGRGRGGYRARGSHTTYNAAQANQSHAYTTPLPQQPFAAGKLPAFGERHRQSSAPYAGIPPQTNQRGPSRSQSIPTHGMFPGMPNNFGSPLSPLQTDVHAIVGGYSTMYPGIMSAIPYNAALEPLALMSMVSAQLEYYFSIENLCKDMYLRSHMDSQGWVPLTVIAGFNRIKSLTEDMNLIRHVCQVSRNIEFRPGDDGTDRLRKLDKWDQWILDMDQRQTHAQNDGPPPLQRSQSPVQPNLILPSMSQTVSPTWASGPFYNGYAEAPGFNAADPLSDDQIFSAPISGNLPEIPAGEDFSLINEQAILSLGQSGDVQGPSPATHTQNTSSDDGSLRNTSIAAMNGCRLAGPQEIGVENVFSNERMNELHVCVRHPTNQYQPPFISSAARTFSHGSIDGVLPGGAQMVNPMPSLRGGAGTPEGFDHVQEQFTSFESSSGSGDRGVFWMKDGAPPDSWNREGSTSEKYQSLHARALAERAPGVVTDDMDWLYQFWSHFLVRNFNFDMYNDFRALAWEDAAAGHDGGIHHLSQYYGALLTGPRVLSEQLAEDIVKLAESEPNDKRQTFYQLRSALRDGAFNLKSRRMIDKFLSPDLKVELE